MFASHSRIEFPINAEFSRALEAYSSRVACDDDRTLFRQGDSPVGLYLILSGIVEAVVHADNGKPAAFFDANPGSILGLPAVLCNRPYSLSARAREGSDVRFVDRESFEDFMTTCPEASLAVLEILAAEVLAARSALYSRWCRSAVNYQRRS